MAPEDPPNAKSTSSLEPDMDKTVHLELRDGKLVVTDYPQAAHIGRLASKTAAELEDYELHRRDLAQCSSALQLLGNMMEGTDGIDGPWDRAALIDTLWAGICVAYCRCFASGRKHKLDPAAIFKNFENAMVAHGFVWDLRNKHYAHDVNDVRQSIVAVALDGLGNNLDIVRGQFTGQWGMADFHNLFNLVDAARKFVDRERRRLVNDLVQEVANLTPGERLALPAPVYVVPKVEHTSLPRSRSRPRAN